MAGPIDQDPTCLFLEEAIVCAVCKVLVEVDDNSAMIFGDLQGSLSEQLGPHPILLLNIIDTLN